LDAGLVAPMDISLFLLGAGLYLGIDRLLPLRHHFWILFVSALGRLLRGESPTLQVIGDRPQGQVFVSMLLDRQPNGLTGPEGKSKFQLVRGLVHQQLLDRRLLFGGQFPLLTIATATNSRLNGLPAAFQELLPNGADMAWTQADNF